MVSAQVSLIRSGRVEFILLVTYELKGTVYPAKQQEGIVTSCIYQLNIISIMGS